MTGLRFYTRSRYGNTNRALLFLFHVRHACHLAHVIYLEGEQLVNSQCFITQLR